MGIMRQSNIEMSVGKADFDLGSFFSDTVDFFTDDIIDYAGPILGTVGNMIVPGLGGAIGGALGSAIAGNNATSNAVDAQVGAGQQAADANWQMYVQSRQDNLPWIRGGYVGLSRLTGMTPEQLANPNAPLSGSSSQPTQTYEDYISGFNTNQGATQNGGTQTSQPVGGPYDQPDGGQQPLSREEWQAQQTQNAGGQRGLIDGPSMQDFESSPYYQYALDEQLRATDRYNASRGLYGSGKGALD